MSSAERLAEYIARSREARKIQASRVSGLITSIANGEIYEFDPAIAGDGNRSDETAVAAAKGGELSGSEREAGAVVGSVGESDDSGSSAGAKEESSG